MNMPVHYPVGTRVRITEKTLLVMRNANANRCRGITYLSDSFLQKARELYAAGIEGEVTRQWLPGYEVNVTFDNGQIMHMKDHYFEPVPADA